MQVNHPFEIYFLDLCFFPPIRTVSVLIFLSSSVACDQRSIFNAVGVAQEECERCSAQHTCLVLFCRFNEAYGDGFFPIFFSFSLRNQFCILCDARVSRGRSPAACL